MSVSAENISHRFNGKSVLESISHTFVEKKITAVLGKSGSGKTTLLQMLNGMIRPDAGLVSIFGNPIDYNHLPALRMQMGYVIQQAGLFPHMSIYANISILGKISNQSTQSIQERVNQLMNLVQLPGGYAKKFPHEISGGEQQRVGLCRAMFLNPPILLMDEPFASLDFKTKQGIYQHILNIQLTEPRTIILITHDWDEALTLADEFLWLENGTIRAAGNTELLRKVRNDYRANK
jgi:osmoprotectant transport system ATP-binding protein